MKRFLLSVVIAISLAFTSCQFDDSDIWSKLGEVEESIRDHEQRISALEELCKQMNTNIEALQTIVSALEKRDYVTNVSEVRSNGVVIGYTISFAYSGAITIYHGQNGTDGYTPQIGVMQDADGIYYWTLDGEWMLDGKGNKIQANSVNGIDGTNGTNGVTPQLKIENDYWYVSYDDGATWVQLGKATGEDGKNGQDSIIIGVEESETEVVFTLSDNTTITIPKHAKSSLADPDDICTAMDDVKFMEYCYKNFDVNKDGKVSPVEAKSVRNIDISGLEIYSIKGIEYFEILETLIAENTPLRNVDISFNNKLISFSFKSCGSMTSVVLPENITNIAAYAFYDCRRLANITIPNSVSKIGDYAFYYCSSLTSVAIPDGVSSINYEAFYNCSRLTSVTIPDSVTSIGSSAFYNCSSLTNVIIPESVTKIGSSAFYGCSSLTSVMIPDSVTEVGSSAFYYCTGELIVNSSKIAETNYHSANYPMKSGGGWLYGSKFTKLTIGGNITKIGSYTFYNCSSLTSVIIPDSVTEIGEVAFAGCGSLTSVYIPNLLAWCNIDFANGSANPLYNTAKLYLNNSEVSELTIPSDITEIKSYAFYYCSSLTSVTIPDSVTSIGQSAFSNCTSLTNVYCKATTPPANGSYMFNGNATGRKIYVPAESIEAYKSASGWSSYASDIVGYDFEKGEIVQPEQPGDITTYLFYENCGEDVEKNAEGYWPYVDAFEGWNPQGDAATNVTYKGQNASVRASGNAYQPTADAVGVSCQPYVFLNKIPNSAHFTIEKIAISGGQNYLFTFNVSCQNDYSGGPTFATVDGSLIHLELGYDGVNWDAVDCTFVPNGGNGWYAATAEFKVKADATTLYARFTYEAPASNGGCRFDDFRLVAGGNGAELTPEAPQQPEQPGQGGGETPEVPVIPEGGTAIEFTTDSVKTAIPDITTNGYGSQNVTSYSTFLTWDYFAACKVCLPPSGDYATANCLQMQGNTDAAKQGRVGNVVATPKRITKVIVESYNAKYTPNFNLALGTEQVVGTSVPANMIPASSMTTSSVVEGALTKYVSTYEVTSGDYTYFAIYKNTTSSLYFSKIRVEYAE